jgi:hypothetical protein
VLREGVRHARGKRITVAGVLRVIDHTDGFVNSVVVPGWVEE